MQLKEQFGIQKISRMSKGLRNFTCNNVVSCLRSSAVCKTFLGSARTTSSER